VGFRPAPQIEEEEEEVMYKCDFLYFHRHDVESFKYLCSKLTKNGRCTCEIKSRIAMAKAAFDKKMALFTSKMDLELR
jgi:hypothetical protein